MILGGTIHNIKVRIIITYMGCSKERYGKEYDAKRKLQKEIKKYMAVEPDVYLVWLGDLNGRLKTLKSHIETDCNWKVVEEWMEKQGLHYLNQSEKCTGVYTYGEEGEKRSAINHLWYFMVTNKFLDVLD